MRQTLSIPFPTRPRLLNPAPPGQRHSEIVKIASTLIGNGWVPEAVFHQIRPNYGPDVPDSEIRSAINWAVNQFLDRRNRGIGSVSRSHRNGIYGPDKRWRLDPPDLTAPEERAESPETAIERYLSGFRCTEEDLWELSPVRLPENWEGDAEAAISALFRPDDRINIVSKAVLSGGKPRPAGFGITRIRSDWLSEFRRNGPPTSIGGCWIRLNPFSGAGIADTDVTDFRFLLLEADQVPMALQIALFARLPLPVVAIISSGGRTLHVWIKVEAPDLSAFRAISARIVGSLAPFGIDQANKSPSRLSRLPGVVREIGGIGQKRQRLLYLNPNPECRQIIR